MKKTFLFLDDIRNPEDAFAYTGHKMFVQEHWQVVRSYTEFVDFIEKNGLPYYISFDHDLAPRHYTPVPLWVDYAKSKAWQGAQIHTEKTGYDCALWVIDYCIDNSQPRPLIYCHSMNPIGKDKIVGLFYSFSQIFPERIHGTYNVD